MLLVAGPWLGLWLVSPFVAWWLSRTLPAPSVRLSDSQRVFLHKLSRRTWRYFEVFVTAEENWLPPDNFQEQPADGVSPRAPARPTSAWHSWRTWPPVTSAIAAPAGCSIASARRSPLWPAWSATAAISTTGTTPVRSSRCSRCMSRRWTAATWPGSCSCCAAACWNCSTRSCCGLASSRAWQTRRTFSWTWPVDFTARTRKATPLRAGGCACSRSSAWQKIWRIDRPRWMPRRRSCNGWRLQRPRSQPPRPRTKKFVGGPAPWSVPAPTIATIFCTSPPGCRCLRLRSGSSDSTNSARFRPAWKPCRACAKLPPCSNRCSR